MISAVILPHPLIQEGQLSVIGESAQVLVRKLRGLPKKCGSKLTGSA